MAGQQKKRVRQIKSLAGVLDEMAAVYGEMRRGQIDTLDGSRMVAALRIVREGVEAIELDARLKRLENERNKP